MSAAFSWLYVEIMQKPLPLQHSIPLIQKTLRTNPLIAWLAVPLVLPVIEEILFRGLFYGVFEKRWGIRGAILGSAFLFACVHLQVVDRKSTRLNSSHSQISYAVFCLK